MGNPSNLCDIESLSSVSTLREDELSHRVELSLKDPDRETIVLSLEDRDSEELILVLQGYYRLLTGRDLHVIRHRDRWAEDQAPPYQARHRVQVAPWSYGLAAVLPEKPKPQSCGETVRSGSSGGSGGSSGSDQDSIENGGGSLSSGSSNSICKPSLVPQQSQPVFRYVDLTLQPPYHQPPDGFVIPYGSIPGSPALSSLSSTSSRVKMEVIESNGGSSFKPQNMMDANMNKT
ncbi:unnamed protein product [Cyprideis torosa]|uniref:Uncharacterized protein n=1 Tax=Cyprideis torosa TaxID=163714 RepID=A0A7R8W9T8_9CRUS|nr:unnamed protein product [Cyprideis torosa]CAG0887647.1 unnamed protein product [Cyprideis torosa]